MFVKVKDSILQYCFGYEFEQRIQVNCLDRKYGLYPAEKLRKGTNCWEEGEGLLLCSVSSTECVSYEHFSAVFQDFYDTLMHFLL
jgi:hypothetical protein